MGGRGEDRSFATQPFVRGDPKRVEALRDRLERFHVVEVLQPFLGNLDEALQRLADVEPVSLRGGERLFATGDEPDGLYIVVDGRLAIASDVTGKLERIGTVSRGDVIGEAAVLRPGPRTTTVTALRDSQLVRLTPARFEAWTKDFPAMPLELARRMADREAGRHRPGPGRLLTLVPHQAPRALRRLVADLPEVLAPHGATIVLDADTFDQRFEGLVPAHTPSDDPRHGLVVGALTELLAQYELVVLVADPTPTAWTRRCVRHADTVVIVADADADEAPGANEVVLAHEAPECRVELVLMHPAATSTPSGTARWLTPGRFAQHHHVRQADPAHLRSLGRRLAGRAIGLVLSGGGARGFAHLGVWRALEEAGVDVDHLGGSSMGALLAAAFGLGITADEGHAHAATFADPRRLFDLTLPVTALFRSAKLRRFITSFYGDRRLEDLWTPTFCVATNLTTAERIVQTTGRMSDAVRASISIPGVFAPVVQDGQLVVDGGVMDNFPVDVMRDQAGSERILAVNVAPPVLKDRRYDIVDQVSGWWVLARRLNPFTRGPRVPSLASTVLRSLEVNSARSSLDQRTRAHLLLEPNVKSVGVLDFHKYEQAAAIGYAAAREHDVRAWAGLT